MRSVFSKLLLVAALLLAVAAGWWLQQPQGRATLARLTGQAATADATTTQTGVSAAASVSASAGAGAAPAPALIEATRAGQRTIRDDAQAVGTLVSRQSTALRPESNGRVTAIHFQDGQRVRKGQLLLQLDDRLERAQLQQVQAELGLAKANYQRNQELVGQGFISKAALDESAATLKVTEARLALAQTQVERLRIMAPFDAVAGIGAVHLGDYLRQGDEVVQLQDMDVLYVDFRLPERLLSALNVGQQAQLQVDALPQEAFTATVLAIDPLVDAQGRSVALRASLPNVGHRLRPGMFARVNLALGQRINAVVVPEQSILADAQGSSVIRLTPWDAQTAATGNISENTSGQWPADTVFRSERVVIQTGARGPGYVEVTQGLQVGDVVMTAGQHRVNRNDQRARVQWVDAAALAQTMTGDTENTSAPVLPAASGEPNRPAGGESAAENGSGTAVAEQG